MNLKGRVWSIYGLNIYKVCTTNAVLLISVRQNWFQWPTICTKTTSFVGTNAFMKFNSYYYPITTSLCFMVCNAFEMTLNNALHRWLHAHWRSSCHGSHVESNCVASFAFSTGLIGSYLHSLKMDDTSVAVLALPPTKGIENKLKCFWSYGITQIFQFCHI